jgi:hypothetical protein
MGDSKDKSKGIAEAVERIKNAVNKEVEQHKDEDVNLEDLEGVSGGWFIYATDSDQKEVGGGT